MHLPSSLEDSLRAWLGLAPDLVRDEEKSLFDRIVRPNAKSLIFYGAGYMGRKAAEALADAGMRPIAFADDHRERAIEGYAFVEPTEIVRQFPGATVFVTIPLPSSQLEEKIHQLRELGCESVFPGAKLFNALDREYFYIDLPHKLLLARNEVLSAFALFSDEDSRREFITQVAMRLSVASDAPQPLPLNRQYWPDEIFSRSDEEFFVDCGAFDGDTIKAFLEWQDGAFGKIVAFEPDRRNFSLLEKSVERLPADTRQKISSIAAAVGAADGTLRFSAIGTAESQVSSDNQGHEVPVSKLDTLMAGQHPTYIKMDIEGAELDALKGAAETIKRARPVLAICVYHRQDDLWKIPLFIHSLCADYRFILRAYMPGRLETVCYAMPKERVIA
jgi:FkbM family methyltransferase